MRLKEIRDKYVSQEATNEETFRSLLKLGMGFSPANQTIQLWISDELGKLKGIKWGRR